MDYGHPVEFGYSLVPDAGDPAGVLGTARLADRLGYDWLALPDRPYEPAHLDALALLGVILAQTERLRAFLDVGDLPLRPPAMFAKAAATLDLLSGGRLEVGIGAGDCLEAAHGMGAPILTLEESIDALEQAILILRVWRSAVEVLRFSGRHYDLDAVPLGPKPAHRIGVWVGAAKPQALALVGRSADGWVAPAMKDLPLADAVVAQAVIDDAACAADRDPASIRRIYNVRGSFTATDRDADRAIVGPPDHWADVLSHLALDLGFGTFVLTAPPDPGTLRTFIDVVAPDVRERVAAARAATSLEPAVAAAAVR